MKSYAKMLSPAKYVTRKDHRQTSVIPAQSSTNRYEHCTMFSVSSFFLDYNLVELTTHILTNVLSNYAYLLSR